MKENLSAKEWSREFRDFMEAMGQTPPVQVTENILNRVRADLNPAGWLVFSKLASIHAVAGVVSLVFCPQFGINPLQRNGLMPLLMRFGDHACMLACGAVFISGTALVSSFFLRPEEVRIIRNNELLQFGILGLLSLGVFICSGANVVLSFAMFWLAGSIFGGLLTLELGWLVRTHLRPHS